MDLVAPDADFRVPDATVSNFIQVQIGKSAICFMLTIVRMKPMQESGLPSGVQSRCHISPKFL